MSTTAEIGTLPLLEQAGREALFTEARTASTFTDQPVTDAELREIWDLARWSPSASNGQPLRVLFVRTDEGRERLLAHVADGNKAKVSAAPVTAVLAFDPDFHEHFATTFPARAEMMRDRFAADADARAQNATYNAALQTGVLLLAVRAAGLAAGPMAGFDKAGVDAEFFGGSGWRSHLLLNIGHPGADAWFPRLPRLDESTVLDWA
ncbi:malonic semialdehyde reductase [Nocardioides sp. GY 10127]|uniref:malonic semialdehyde reductase n=1 Tax=Nocardioides sp. GY 10127 TaxID=2569762 RepID=UPI0010A7A510|nr:malonic semialdehyde reductase [Nocardioides sp. GY 10127]TIC81562.1 malonic semialdehyde reductase [Nocardioides sp. GY 10127]